jgi:hypothetical protein
VREADGVPWRRGGERARVRGAQRSLVVLAAQKVERMRSAILPRELGEVPVDRRLRGVRTRDLDALAKSLHALLLPEHCVGSVAVGTGAETTHGARSRGLAHS